MSILYKDDYCKNGLYIAKPDSTTKNLSFLKMAAILQRMGVNNYTFMLALYDQRLAGIDPHKLNDFNDPDGRMRSLVIAEAKLNFWYFVREVARVPSQGGDPTPFILNRANMAFIWLFLNNITTYVIQPRQTGKSLTACLINAWVLYIRGQSMEVGLLVHRSKAKTENVERIKSLRDNLPNYLIRTSKSDTENKEGLGYAELDTKYLTEVGSQQEEQSLRIYRGGTIVIFHVDEIAFIPNIAKTYPSMMAASATAKENAAKNYQPYANIITTTAGDPETKSGKYALDLLNEAMSFSETIYDCNNKEELLAVINKNSVGAYPMVSCVFSYLQLGKSHKWFEEVSSMTRGTMDDIARDYLNQWLSASDDPVISKEMMAKIRAHEQTTPIVEFINGYKFSWYIPPNVPKHYYKDISLVLGMDSSDMSGGDFTTFVAIDPRDLAVVFTFRCNESNIAKLSIMITHLLMTYPKMTWVPERKSSAAGIIDTVIIGLQKENINPFKRIFNRIVDNIHLAEYRDININDPRLCESKERRYLGFMTSGKSRPILYKEVLQTAVSMSYNKIFDTTLISELSGLQKVNGRVDHGTGRHDDMVISWLLACYLVVYGKNLKHYGIDSNLLLSDITNDSGRKSNPILVDSQRRLLKEIDEITAIINKTTSPTIKNTLLMRLNELKSGIIPGVIVEQPYAVDRIKRDYGSYENSIDPTAVKQPVHSTTDMTELLSNAITFPIYR